MSCDNKRGYTSDHIASMSDKVTLRSTGGEGCTSDPPPVAAETPEQIAARHFPEMWRYPKGKPVDYVYHQRMHCLAALRDQASQYDARIAELDEAVRSAILRMGNAEQRAQSAEAKYDAAVGQVARFVVAIPQWKISVESAVAKLDPQKCSFAERNRLIRLIDYMEEALASSVPLVAARDAELEKWKQAVIEACVVNCIGWDENDPIKTLADLVAWEVKVALDPKVSKEAAEIEAGALEELADDFQSVRLVCYASGEPIPDLVNALRARAQEKRKAGTQAH